MDETVNLCMSALNSLGCCGRPRRLGLGGGAGALDYIRRRVAERGAPPANLTQEEAARMLLRPHAGYETVDGGETSVVLYREGRVALPNNVFGAPRVADIALPRVSPFIDPGLDRMLLRSKNSCRCTIISRR